jgi:hypothetical protein
MVEREHTYDTPVEGPSAFKMVWKELDKKASKEVVETKMEALGADIERVEIETRKPHACAQDSRFSGIEGLAKEAQREAQDTQKTVVEVQSNVKEVQKSISDMYKWYARGLGALILVLLTSGVAFVWYLSGLSYNLEANNVRLEKIELKTDQAKQPPLLDAAALEPLLQRVADVAARKAQPPAPSPQP